MAPKDSNPADWKTNRLVPAMLLAGLASLTIGWLAFLISRAGVAPAVLFPVSVGLAVGAAQTAVLQKLHLSLPGFAVAILSLACGTLAVASEDYSGYRDYLGDFEKVQSREHLASVAQAATDQWRPAGFLAYLSAVIRRDPVWWPVDAVLTLLAAAVVAGVISHRTKAAPLKQHAPPQPANPDSI